jgi:regulator of protease activity HflC (stomatin/prohibitin superfamily)
MSLRQGRVAAAGIAVAVVIGMFILIVVATVFERQTGKPGFETYVVRKPWGGKTTYVQTLQGVESTPLNIFYEVAEELDMRPKRHMQEFSVTVKGDVNIRFRAHVVVALRPGQSKQVIEEFGKNFYERKIQRPFSDRVRVEVTRYSVFEVKSKRNEIAAAVLADLRKQFADTPFVILDVLTGNIDYDQTVKNSAVQASLRKEESKQRDIQLQIQAKDNTIKETEAEAIRASQDIIRGSLTRQYNMWNGLRAIEELAGATEGHEGPAPNTTFIFAPIGSGQFSMILGDQILGATKKPVRIPTRR